MQYTPHYNLNLPEGTDIVNPLVQDNPNYTAIDTALYDNKLRVTGTATHVKTGTNHAITLADSDINQFKFVATGDYATGDTFTVDGVTVTPRIADGSSIPNGAFKINSTVLCILDGTVLNLINVESAAPDASAVEYDNTGSGLSANNVQGAIDEIANGVKNFKNSIDLSIPNGSTGSVHIASLSRGVLYTVGDDDACGSIVFRTQSDGSVNLEKLGATGLNITRDPNYIRIRNVSGYTCQVNGLMFVGGLL